MQTRPAGYRAGTSYMHSRLRVGLLEKPMTPLLPNASILVLHNIISSHVNDVDGEKDKPLTRLIFPEC